VGLFTTFLLSCSGDDPIRSDSLAYYVENAEDLAVRDSSIIACAAGKEDSVNIYYYPAPGYSDFRLWKLLSAKADPTDLNNYTEVIFEQKGLFNGYLAYYLIEGALEETWFTISGQSASELVIAQPILLKQATLPT